MDNNEENKEQNKGSKKESAEGQGNALAVPGAIVIAGLIIAGAIFYSNSGGARLPNDPNVAGVNAGQNGGAVAPERPRPLTTDDHILGSPQAPIVIVEYSDTECPFCKRFHNTMHEIIDTYGDDGQVAWVYRHFPIPTLHPSAQLEAEATECAWELGGNEGFWKYTDRIYEITPSNNGLDESQLPEIAVEAGLDRDAFVACLDSGKYTEKVNADRDEAIATGGRGTPHSILLIGDQMFPIEGAQEFSTISAIIDQILAQADLSE